MDAHDSQRHSLERHSGRPRHIEDVQVHALSSQLHAEQVRSSQTSTALDATLRALREQEQIADTLRVELDAATFTAAASATRANQSAALHAAWEADIRSAAPPA